MYLVTLGVQALRSAQRPAALVDRDRGPGVLGVGYRSGLVTNLLNPKIGVFFVTFLPGFVPAGAPVSNPTSPCEDEPDQTARSSGRSAMSLRRLPSIIMSSSSLVSSPPLSPTAATSSGRAKW